MIPAPPADPPTLVGQSVPRPGPRTLPLTSHATGHGTNNSNGNGTLSVPHVSARTHHASRASGMAPCARRHHNGPSLCLSPDPALTVPVSRARCTAAPR